MAANNFLSPPSKRPLMSDSSNSLSSNAVKRAKPQPPPLPIPSGHASLRMLCHASLIGSFIGKSGSSIKTLQLNTGSKIRVEDSLQLGSDDRVIVIVAPSIRIKKMSLLHRSNGDGEFEMEVSAVQEAAVRVFERVMEITGEVTTAFCRLLVEESQAGSVIGKGGKIVEKLRRESGAKIRVLLGDKLPPGVSSPDEVVEIEGDVLAVEKALLGVCGQLQECRQADKSSIKDNESRPSELNSKSSVNEFRADPPRHQMPSSVATSSYSPALVGRLSSFEPDRLHTRSNSQSSAYDFHADPPLHQTPLSVATTSYSPALVGMPSSFEPDRLHTQSNSQSSVYDFRANPPLHQMPLSVASNSYSPALVGRPSSFEPDRPFTQSNSQSSVYGFRADPPLHQTPLSVATTSSGPALVGRSSSFEPDRLQNPDIKLQQQEVIFKILCSNDRVGGVIGRGGSIIKALQEESGASINVGSSVADCDERLVTISSKEDVDSRYSPAQRAVVLVYSRFFEAGADRGLETGLNKGSSVSARLVVPSNQAGCLLGKGGVIISEMRKATGASIHILKGDHLPKCVAQDDEVVEISGQFGNIQGALYHVTSRLRNNLFTSKTTNTSGSGTGKLISDTTIHGRVRDMAPSGLQHSSMTSQSIDGQATLRQGLDPSFRPHVSEHSPSVGLRTSECLQTAGVNPRSFVNLDRGLASANGGVDLGRTHRPTFVTNTKVEMSVPESAISSVYGENGRNLTRIRQISGAQVIVHEALPRATHRTVVISGTPDETQAAQSLLHAFILTGSS